MTYPFSFAMDALDPAPFPHVLCQPFLDPDLYARLRAELPADDLFEAEGSAYGRTSRDLYRGDPLFNEFIAGSPAWREFYERVNSPTFLELAVRLFGAHLSRFGCRLDAEKLWLSDYVEPRNELTEATGFDWLRKALRTRIKGGVDPEELFVRFDLGQAGVGYAKRVHCDLPNRLCSMIIYFSDADESESDGGELLLYEHREGKGPVECPRYPREADVRIIEELTPRENLGLFFLCSNNSYHGVRPIRAQRRYRTFVYINISSRSPRIWP